MYKHFVFIQLISLKSSEMDWRTEPNKKNSRYFDNFAAIYDVSNFSFSGIWPLNLKLASQWQDSTNSNAAKYDIKNVVAVILLHDYGDRVPFEAVEYRSTVLAVVVRWVFLDLNPHLN